MRLAYCRRGLRGRLTWGEVYEVREVLPFSGMLRVLTDGAVEENFRASHFAPVVEDEAAERARRMAVDPEMEAAFEVARELDACDERANRKFMGVAHG